MKSQGVSDAVIRRLPRYYRHLELLVAKGVERISSSELAKQMQLNPSQIRQDFNCFGGFGQQGYGYHVATLYQEIGTILGLPGEYRLVVVGAGNLAQALTRYEGFPEQGFHVVALFDNDEALIGREIAGITVQSVDMLEAYIREQGADIGVITARRSAAQDIADTMVAAGVKGIWNFVPTDIQADVPVQNVHLIDSVLTLSFALNHQD